MNYFALFLFVLSTLSATAMPPIVRQYDSLREPFKARTAPSLGDRGSKVRKVISASVSGIDTLGMLSGNITWALSTTRRRSKQSNYR